MQIKTKNKIYIISSVYAFIVAFMILFLVWPTMASIKEKSLDLVLIKNNISSLAEEKSHLKDFQKKYESYRPNLEKMENMFVDQKSPVDFIKFLEASSVKSGISSEISMPPSMQNEKFVVFQVTASGLPAGILQFMNNIEGSAHALEIQSFSMKESAAVFSIKVYSK